MIYIRRRIIKYLCIALSLMFLCFIYTAYEIRLYSKIYYDTPSDVAIVLGAGTSGGKLSNVYKERVLHAINLLKKQQG